MHVLVCTDYYFSNWKKVGPSYILTLQDKSNPYCLQTSNGRVNDITLPPFP